MNLSKVMHMKLWLQNIWHSRWLFSHANGRSLAAMFHLILASFYCGLFFGRFEFCGFNLIINFDGPAKYHQSTTIPFPQQLPQVPTDDCSSCQASGAGNLCSASKPNDNKFIPYSKRFMFWMKQDARGASGACGAWPPAPSVFRCKVCGKEFHNNPGRAGHEHWCEQRAKNGWPRRRALLRLRPQVLSVLAMHVSPAPRQPPKELAKNQLKSAFAYVCIVLIICWFDHGRWVEAASEVAKCDGYDLSATEIPWSHKIKWEVEQPKCFKC